MTVNLLPLLSLSLTPVDAERVMRPNLSALTGCLQNIESNRPVRVTFEVNAEGKVSALTLTGANLQVDDVCLLDMQRIVMYPSQLEAIQFVSFRMVHVNGELQLLPGTKIRLPETIFPGIFAREKLKNDLLQQMDK